MIPQINDQISSGYINPIPIKAEHVGLVMRITLRNPLVAGRVRQLKMVRVGKVVDEVAVSLRCLPNHLD